MILNKYRESLVTATASAGVLLPSVTASPFAYAGIGAVWLYSWLPRPGLLLTRTPLAYTESLARLALAALA